MAQRRWRHTLLLSLAGACFSCVLPAEGGDSLEVPLVICFEPNGTSCRFTDAGCYVLRLVSDAVVQQQNNGRSLENHLRGLESTIFERQDVLPATRELVKSAARRIIFEVYLDPSYNVDAMTQECRLTGRYD